jgi:signal transduction histidine kinase
MGGQIWADSPGRDRGSTFGFTLPLARGNVRPAIEVCDDDGSH